ncbi:ABC transporter permease [Metallibacterium sp.]|uniref:ABC transporter permease n=2 Tax=Metallibacterium sp. TaxID=2940281 RepID=UPI00262C30CA|nr:ABC transporter permease [Metallibacterium sp.]
MYLLTESLRSALTAIRANKLRSVLTTLGIVLGVAAVVTVVALLQGFTQAINTQFAGLGSDTLIVQSYLPLQEQMEGKVAKVTPSDMRAIAAQIPGIASISPILPLNLTVTRHGQSTSASVLAGTAVLAESFGFWPSRGRFITRDDTLRHRHVAVIGRTVLEHLHLHGDPVGQFIQLDGSWFRIVGEQHKLGTMLGQDRDNQIIIPYGTGLALLGNSAVPNIAIEIKLAKGADLDAVKGRIETLLRRLHHLKPGQADNFKVGTAAQLLASFNAIFTNITLIAGAIVGISLLVGGIGIMNIMLVSVTERTREIGILKSLGATRGDILLQFLIEAATLSLLGGLIGLILGYGVGLLVLHFVPAFGGASVPIWAAFLAIGFSAAVGVVFGIAPAARAASLDPIVALSYG